MISFSLASASLFASSSAFLLPLACYQHVSFLDRRSVSGPPTSDSNFLNSSSFFFLYSSISFCASARASFTRFVRSESSQSRPRKVGGFESAHILWLRYVSEDIRPGSWAVPCWTIFWASFSDYKRISFVRRRATLVIFSRQAGSECPLNFGQTVQPSVRKLQKRSIAPQTIFGEPGTPRISAQNYDLARLFRDCLNGSFRVRNG